MKKISIIFIGIIMIFISTNVDVVSAKDKIIEGVLSEYDCGDNCYLTIIVKGKERTGLCTASLCGKWSESETLPVELKGRKVRVTVGKGVQYDSAGNARCKMDEFKKIVLLKK